MLGVGAFAVPVEGGPRVARIGARWVAPRLAPELPLAGRPAVRGLLLQTLDSGVATLLAEVDPGAAGEPGEALGELPPRYELVLASPSALDPWLVAGFEPAAGQSDLFLVGGGEDSLVQLTDTPGASETGL